MKRARKTKVGNFYFVKSGERTGQFLALVDFDSKMNIFSVLGLPELDVLHISDEEFKKYVEDEIVEFVEKSPKFVTKELLEQFNLQKTKVK